MTNPKTYRKTATIQALQLTPDNLAACKDFAGSALQRHMERWVIQTLEGPLGIEWNDWIAQGGEGEFWPIREDIFDKSYALDLGAPTDEPPTLARRMDCLRDMIDTARALGITAVTVDAIADAVGDR